MSTRARAVEVGILVGFCLFLPIYEAPKSILWVLYALTWIVNRVRERDFGGRWDGWDTIFAVWIASGFAAAAFAGHHGDEWRATVDLVRYAGMAWLVKRARYDALQTRAVLGSLIVSLLIGLVQSYPRHWSGQDYWLSLNSVGHVNHTAIYMAIVLAISAAWAFAFWRSWSIGWRIAAVAVNAVILVSLIVAASRGALVGAAVMLLVVAAWWRARSRVPLRVTAIALTVTIAVLVVANAEAVKKFELNLARNSIFSLRDKIWRVGFLAWQHYPVFGVGMDNYARTTKEVVQNWLKEDGKEYVPSRYEYFNHAHSLYVNTITERGTVGLAVLLLLFGAWVVCLKRWRPRPEDPDDDWLFWGASLGALTVTAISGIVNTTLHHEHGTLAALLLGLWLSRARQQRPVVRG